MAHSSPSTPRPVSSRRRVVGARVRAFSLGALLLTIPEVSARVAAKATAVHVTNHAHVESCGKGCTETVYDDDTAYVTSTDDVTAATTADADDGSSSASGGPEVSSLDCTQYDDDVVYDSQSCLSYDEVACEYNCQDGSFCAELCGEGSGGDFSCDDGAGAVCAMNMLNDLVGTCSTYQEYAETASAATLARWSSSAAMGRVDGRHGRRATPAHNPMGRVDGRHGRRATPAHNPAAYDPSPYLEDWGAVAFEDDVSSGCDDHAYCEFCDEWCEEAFGDLGFAVFGSEMMELKKLGRGPFAMYLLNNLGELCAQFENMTVVDTSAGTITDPYTGLVTAIDGTPIVVATAEEAETFSPPFWDSLFERFSGLVETSREEATGTPAESSSPGGIIPFFSELFDRSSTIAALFAVGGVALAAAVAKRRERYSPVPDDEEFEI